MKLLFVFSVLFSLLFLCQTPASNNENSPLVVTSFKWSRAHRTVETQPEQVAVPQRAMIPQNKIFARNARINDPAGVRDPNADTLDGRSEALEKSVQESRSAKPKSTDGYTYKIKVQNPGPKAIEIVFWEYQFQDPSDPSLLARRQFLCGVNIGADKNKELEGFSLSGPSEVVNVKTLANKTENPFKERVEINRLEYSDGSIWQRKDWSLNEVKASYDRVLREQWTPGTCKGL
ncbi:MAG TPA: hypothetical protein VJ749_03500 [Pyrinomonadaceae bacterium]|jgi:hypothetical protein|nr:hypothetical protein [Pyrinomonadaceae bacterium]